MSVRETPRTRRLRSDLRALQQLRQDSSVFDFVAYGNPPERYDMTLMGAGLKLSDDQARVEVQMVHRIEVRLGANYPRAMPELAWRTPIFHPNISAIGMVCLGGYGQFWVPSLQLDELCVMLWDMVRFENFDVTSPYNRSAADWTRSQTQFTFPLDRRSLRDRLTRSAIPSVPGAAATGFPGTSAAVFPPAVYSGVPQALETQNAGTFRAVTLDRPGLSASGSTGFGPSPQAISLSSSASDDPPNAPIAAASSTDTSGPVAPVLISPPRTWPQTTLPQEGVTPHGASVPVSPAVGGSPSVKADDLADVVFLDEAPPPSAAAVSRLRPPPDDIIFMD